jgi:hypothetical protein
LSSSGNTATPTNAFAHAAAALASSDVGAAFNRTESRVRRKASRHSLAADARVFIGRMAHYSSLWETACSVLQLAANDTARASPPTFPRLHDQKAGSLATIDLYKSMVYGVVRLARGRRHPENWDPTDNLRLVGRGWLLRVVSAGNTAFAVVANQVIATCRSSSLLPHPWRAGSARSRM